MYGNLGDLQLGMQNSFGTAVSDAGSFSAISIVNESLNETIEQLAESGMYGRLGEAPYRTGARKVEGSVGIEAGPVSLGWLLRAACGQITTTVSSVQSHVFEPQTADFDASAALTPATIQINRDVGSSHIFQDLVCSKLSMGITQGQLLTADADFIGTFFARVADAAPTYNVLEPFTWRVASAGYNGAVLNDITEFNVTLDNQLEAVYFLTNTNIPQRILRSGPVQVTGGLTMLFFANSIYDNFLDQDENSFALHFNLDQSSASQLTLALGSMRFENMEANLSGPGLLEVSAGFRGIFNTNSNAAIRYTLVNCQESYS